MVPAAVLRPLGADPDHLHAPGGPRRDQRAHQLVGPLHVGRGDAVHRGEGSEVDPVRRLIGAASAWGGNPDKDALYLNVTPPKNDGQTVYKLNVKDVPVAGFWSISRYNEQGYFVKNEYNAYSLNNITAKANADGSVTIQFGGCDGKIPNCLPTEKGWNYMVRLYRPAAAILNGKWKFPEPQTIN